ncbi:transposase-like zinc ribbon protein [Gillisia sp. Hel_I_86]|uniref:IS1595 family transposase n=1 Tax=Gillisia sp. Hel_I_86 TaxID=1249981 RepID=UPI00119B73DA|nr:IS1595 family transposase [Gillisia sp. Hel_I_86]TVZ26518.1 transposase-like zinc ribbon protein [Gillisia sp. Hel_I_86]TVZ28459.1 transposase-like zinc ribbon protein [Gillisia sp. Hel_I_86]TVZ28729.1 transposase-like zinc ribbon protein [Gillisia sp. Hel_I_86]
MNIFSFGVHFTDEESCRLHFKEQRDKEGVVCHRCGSIDHYWLKNKWSYQCKSCKARMSLRSGTIMESSKLSFMSWYKTIFLLSTTKKGFSSKEIQRQLGLKRYEPVWAMVHKLRKAMGQRDDRYTLEGMIEMDEGYFTIEASQNDHQTQKAGRGSKTKSNVMVLAESTVLEDIKTGKVERHCRYFKAKVLDNHEAGQTSNMLKSAIADEHIIIFSDQSTSYVDIADYVELHITEKSSEKTTKETLKWVHIAISNAKRNFVGTYHKIKKKYLQLYLNEFVYKLNRRYFGDKLFDRLVIASITASGH